MFKRLKQTERVASVMPKKSKISKRRLIQETSRLPREVEKTMNKKRLLMLVLSLSYSSLSLGQKSNSYKGFQLVRIMVQSLNSMKRRLLIFSPSSTDSPDKEVVEVVALVELVPVQMKLIVDGDESLPQRFLAR